jgi:hypothetical protein
MNMFKEEVEEQALKGAKENLSDVDLAAIGFACHVSINGREIAHPFDSRGVGYIAPRSSPEIRIGPATYCNNFVHTKKHLWLNSKREPVWSPSDCIFVLNGNRYPFKASPLQVDPKTDYAKLALDGDASFKIQTMLDAVIKYTVRVRSPLVGEVIYGVLPGPKGIMIYEGKVIELCSSVGGLSDVEHIKHNIPSTASFSGMPLFAASDGCLVGMHRGGYESLGQNYATAMNSTFAKMIRTNESIINIRIAESKN